MTICVAVKVHDCIVFASDSASTLMETIIDADGRPTTRITNVYQHAHKVFRINCDIAVAAMTCGLGNIGPISISTLAKDLRIKLESKGSKWSVDPKNFTIEELINKARDFFFEEHYQKLNPKPEGNHNFSFWIGGNSAGAMHGEIWRFRIVNGLCEEPECLAPADKFDILSDGQPEAINRLVKGYSHQLPQALLDMGLSEADLPKALALIESRTRARLIEPAMPVQDAIALADFLVGTTKRYVRFLPGPDTVGGETDICVVSQHEGFKWIKRKHYYDARLNPKGD